MLLVLIRNNVENKKYPKILILLIHITHIILPLLKRYQILYLAKWTIMLQTWRFVTKPFPLRNSQAIACLVFMVLNSHLYDVNFLYTKVWLIRLVGLKGLGFCLYI